MMAFTSLAVDLGRYEIAHTQLYNAAVSAARAGAAAIPYGASAVTAAADADATQNTVDGQAITNAMVTVQYIKWTNASNYTIESTANFAQANAVRVTITYTVPLLFAQVIGYANKSASEFSTAELSIQTASPYVYATGNPWLAGEPAGTHASQADPNYTSLHGNSDHQYPYDVAGTPGKNTDGSSATATSYNTVEPTSSPVQLGFKVTPGATILVTNVSGSSSYDHGTPVYLDATGNQGSSPYIVSNAAANGVSEHGISDASMPAGSANALFLQSNSAGTGPIVPDGAGAPAAPAKLDFSTQAARDYTSISPKLQQVFYIGNGQTSGHVQQQIVVPANASYMFLGVMDGWEWDNNLGGFNMTITEAQIFTVQ
jgi:hypothetical protein